MTDTKKSKKINVFNIAIVSKDESKKRQYELKNQNLKSARSLNVVKKNIIIILNKYF